MPRPATTVPGIRPLTTPALGFAVAIVAMTALLLPRLPLSWTAYRLLATHADGAPTDEIPGALYRAAYPAWPEVPLAVLLFGCAVAFLAAWVSRARRNAGIVAPHYRFRYSPVTAVVSVLTPVGNLFLAGPVIAEIVDASRPPAARSRPVLERAWWLCMLAGLVALTAAAVVANWTPVGRHASLEGRAVMPSELASQLAVAVLQTAAAVGLVTAAILLMVLMARVTGWQARTAHAITPPQEIGTLSGVQSPALVRAAGACAAVTTLLLAAMSIVHVAAISTYDFDFSSWSLTTQAFFFLVVPLIGFNIGQVLALGISTVRFGRRPQRSATSLAVVASVVAWIRLFLGPPAPIPEEFGIYLHLQLANWIVSIGCVVTVALVVRASRPMATSGLSRSFDRVTGPGADR
jgi:hypothetical protein